MDVNYHFISFAISLVGLILLVFVEEKVKSPIIELSLFKEKIFTASSIIYMIFGFAIIVPSLILNYFLQNVRGYSALHSAYLIVPTSLAIALGMPLATKMYQKLSAKLLIGIGMFITAAGLFMLSLVQFETSEAIIICCNVIIGLGLGFMVMSMTASVRYLPVIKAGIGSGIVDASRYIGQEIGMALLVTILNANINTARDNIRHYAYVQIDKHVLSDSVKSVVKIEIKEIFESTSKTTDSSKKQNQMPTKVKAAAKKTDNLPLPKKGSDYRELYDANSQLVVGSEKVVANLPKQISSALTPLSQGQAQLGQGIQLLAQKEELTDTFQKIKDSKNKNLSRAFNQVFIIASLIVLITSPLAHLTDKKVKE
ncbi:permease of the major facilitator superfamily protein [Streptococcus infantarius subsp. infantarius]|nr:permease of the major facilitator superfamily protein [Streptococcus infantarius subsp. infantarius]MCO4506127.1 permease of the major facilitator superfamily protein [Streptococcus infantarius subsp. infantarius]